MTRWAKRKPAFRELEADLVQAACDVPRDTSPTMGYLRARLWFCIQTAYVSLRYHNARPIIDTSVFAYGIALDDVRLQIVVKSTWEKRLPQESALFFGCEQLSPPVGFENVSVDVPGIQESNRLTELKFIDWIVAGRCSTDAIQASQRDLASGGMFYSYNNSSRSTE